MKKDIIYCLTIFVIYFVFITLINKLFSFSYWPLYLGGLVGLFMPNLDHLLHVFIINPHELTSLRLLALIKEKRYKDVLLLLYYTKDERTNLIFHSVNFQLIFVLLTFWVLTSSGSLFGQGLVVAYLLSIVSSIKDKKSNYFYIMLLILFIFSFLI